MHTFEVAEPGRGGAQGADGGFAVVAQQLDRLVEELGLVLLAGGGVAPPQSGQDFVLRFGAHVGVHRG